MEVDKYQSESEGESASDMQQKTDAMECDGHSSETNDASPSDATDSQPNPRRTRQAYTLAFKLSVVEAYRNNGECKGNQRATARKFHIHRRQVQRWIRDERALSQKLKLRVAAAEIARGSVKKDATQEALGNDTYQHQTSSQTTTACEIQQNTGYFPPDVAGHKRKFDEKEPATDKSSTSVDGAQNEDAVIDLSVSHRGDALYEPTTVNAENENLEPSVKRTVLAAYHSANKWHGITAAVAQKFGIMVCDLIRWLKEERESNMLFSSPAVQNGPAGLSIDTYLSANANSSHSDMYLAVLRQEAEISAAHYYTQEGQRSEITAAISTAVCRWPNIHVDAVSAGETLKCWYRQISQLHFTNYNVMRGPSYQYSTVQHLSSTQDSQSQIAFHNAQFPAVRPALPPNEGQH